MGSKIIRPNKDFPIFGAGSQADELKIFGTDTESTDITLLLTNPNAGKGWASGVDANGFPALSWFNAVGHTLSYITAYYLQNGIPEWVALQEYFIGGRATASNGFTYVSKTNNNIGNTPVGDATNWRLAMLDSANTVVYTPTADYHPATKKFVDDAIAAVSSAGLLSIDDLLHVRDEKVTNTDGGSSSSGTNIRALNTVKTNTSAGASISANQITLQAGSYYIEASAPAFGTDKHKIYLYNVTDAAVAIIGSNEDSIGNVSTTSILGGVVTVSATKVFELRHQIAATVATLGLGIATNAAGINEVYADMKVWGV